MLLVVVDLEEINVTRFNKKRIDNENSKYKALKNKSK
jgi:hypothetical protein